MTTVVEYLAGRLWDEGARRVYGLPGGENVEILEAIRRRGFEFVLVRNESSACFMAATDARLTATPGVALTTLGPGAANAMAGLAHAWLDRAPILLLTAASDPGHSGRHTHQVLDLDALFRPVSKFTADLAAATAGDQIERALACLRTGRPGPARLGIHNSVALQAIANPPKPSPATMTPTQRPSQADLAAFLRGKRKPVIVAGLGLEPERPYAQLRRLAEALSAPLIDTPKSKGALPADHPLCAGTIGLTAVDPVYKLLDEADAIIAVGFDVVELVKPWDQPQPLLWIANWENVDPVIACACQAVGPMAETLERLANIGAPGDADWGAERVRAFRGKLAEGRPSAAETGRMLPQAMLKALRDCAPDDLIISTDVGSHKILAALEWPARQPNRYFVSNGLSAMGFGLTSAIAAAKASGQPSLCITGDAGLAMVLGELGILQETGGHVIVIVMNDSALDLIRSAQQKRGRAVFGTEFRNPDFALIARACDIAYRRVWRRSDFVAAVEGGLRSRAPMLIDVLIDPSAYPMSVR